MLPWIVGLAVLLAGGLADFGAESFSQLSPSRWYAASLGALLLFALATPLETLVARLAPPRARVDLWRAMQAASVVSALATWTQLRSRFHDPLWISGVTSLWEQLDPQHLAVPLAASLCAWWFARTRVPSRMVLRAALSTVIAVATLALASHKVHRAPPPWNLVDTLPLVGELPPFAPGAATVTATVGAVTVRRFRDLAHPGFCDVRLAQSAADLPTEIPWMHLTPVGCGSLTLRTLPVTHELAVVPPAERYRNVFVFDPTSPGERPSSTGRATLSQYAQRLSPPPGWVHLSWAILATALLAFVPRPSLRRWQRHRDTWRAATLAADGTLTFEDGTTAPLSYGHALAPGPVVVLATSAPTAQTPFRKVPSGEAVSRDDVRAGTVASVLATLDAQRDAAWARVTATAWWACAPMASYVAFGVLP